MRAAAIAIEYELPRLAVTAQVNAGDFADQLERAIERSRTVSPMIEAKPIVSTDTVSSGDTTKPHMQTSINGKPTIVDRRYRRW